MNDLTALHKVVFLDTNTLHYIGVYLNWAKVGARYPQDVEKDVAIKNIEELAEADLTQTLKRGMQTLSVLSINDVQVQYAPLSELELLTARTKGMAIVSAAQEGLPDRIWSRFREEEIRDRARSNDLAGIKERIDGLTGMFESSGIAVRASDKERAGDVLELAKHIGGLIYMDLVDSIIYASAIVARSDYLFTADQYLRDTINRIHNPHGEADYGQIRQKLRQFVSAMTLQGIGGVDLPSAHTVTPQGEVRPNLPVSRGRRK